VDISGRRSNCERERRRKKKRGAEDNRTKAEENILF
jgi:hypothetical protein